MFWVITGLVFVALFAAAWFASGRSKKKFGNPDANSGNVGAAKGYAAMRDIGRHDGGPSGF
jgi:hypothetical protein